MAVSQLTWQTPKIAFWTIHLVTLYRDFKDNLLISPSQPDVSISISISLSITSALDNENCRPWLRQRETGPNRRGTFNALSAAFTRTAYVKRIM
jgi:hypothetical protein